MPTAIVTGSGGLIGSEAAAHFANLGYDVLGVDNDLRAQLFGPEASTAPTTRRLAEHLGSAFRSVDLDIRDRDGVDALIADHASSLEVIIHAAAQPSHDWAARDPHTDFGVNATGTLNLLESLRRRQPSATFIFMSTNKVYGDHPNRLPLIDTGDRLDLPESDPRYGGIGTDMSVDHCMHSLFGVSKTAADLMVQEYGRYFDMPTVCFRGGCLTGPAHAGAELHGFLSYLMRCVVEGRPYTIFGYEGKQVRDNIHSHDVVRAMEAFHRSPRPAAVYNLGGGRSCSCSVLEAIALCEQIAGKELDWSLSDQARAGDHRWWISDLDAFANDYPDWSLTYSLERTLREIHAAYEGRTISS